MLSDVATRESQRIPSVTPASIVELMPASQRWRALPAGLSGRCLSQRCGQFSARCVDTTRMKRASVASPATGLSASEKDGLGEVEARSIISEEMADAAFGRDLATYIASPYREVTLCREVHLACLPGKCWRHVAAAQLTLIPLILELFTVLSSKPSTADLGDALMLDVVRTADVLGTSPRRDEAPFHSEVLITDLEIPREKFLGISQALALRDR